MKKLPIIPLQTVKNTEKFREKKNSAFFSVFLSRIRVENTEKFREKKEKNRKMYKRNVLKKTCRQKIQKTAQKEIILKNLPQKNTEKCTKKYTEKIYRQKIL